MFNMLIFLRCWVEWKLNYGKSWSGIVWILHFICRIKKTFSFFSHLTARNDWTLYTLIGWHKFFHILQLGMTGHFIPWLAGTKYLELNCWKTNPSNINWSQVQRRGTLKLNFIWGILNCIKNFILILFVNVSNYTQFILWFNSKGA